ncbi:hypothetical protein [Actinomadura sp. KC216]|uniref:hypothetical protein n=1 Tax=Actinomadura sp. KC216 TaxID=2530370 RepID=UPI001405207C|nr:hypothetical protein [Actinomadura sp. KC216]
MTSPPMEWISRPTTVSTAPEGFVGSWPTTQQPPAPPRPPPAAPATRGSSVAVGAVG